MAIMEGTRLIVGNVGDSRGVMCDFKGNAIPLSFDHKPQQVRLRTDKYKTNQLSQDLLGSRAEAYPRGGWIHCFQRSMACGWHFGYVTSAW